MANIKFSQFTAEADIANFDDIVGYAGAINTRITPANLASSLITLSGGPYLPLTAGASEKLTGDLNLAATGAGPSVGSQAVVFNGVDDTSTAVISAKIFTLDSTANPAGQDLIFQNANDAGAIQTNFYISAFGQVGIGGFTPASPPQFNLDVSGDSHFGGVANFADTIVIDNDITDTAGNTGQTGQVLAAKPAGVEWVNGYQLVQVFQWNNGNPVAYTNFPPGSPPGTPTVSFLPFNTTPSLETNNLPSGTTISNYGWTCNNTPGGDAGEVAAFTLGGNGDGTWLIRTGQHWFDQNYFVDVNCDIVISPAGGGPSTTIRIVNDRHNDGDGDKLMYGELFYTFGAGDVVQFQIGFSNYGSTPPPVSNPFPSDQGNRPIEVSFEKIA